MNRPSRLLGAISLICLLTMQASGLHMHVDETGRSAGLHSAHVHQVHREDHHDHNFHESASHQGDLHAHPSRDHDHSQESDVSLFEQVNATPYSDTAYAGLDHALPVPAPLWVQLPTPAPSGGHQYNLSRTHWQPPLRAPPPFV